MRKRNHQIIVRLDDEELLMLKRKIHRSDLTMAEYFRLLIENGELKMIDQDVQHDMRRKLQGIAVNINQMARLAHIKAEIKSGCSLIYSLHPLFIFLLRLLPFPRQ